MTKQFFSSSLDQTVAEMFMIKERGNVIYEITSQHGINISATSTVLHEAEIVFIPGVKFKVAGTTYLPRFDISDPLIKVVLLEEL